MQKYHFVRNMLRFRTKSRFHVRLFCNEKEFIQVYHSIGSPYQWVWKSTCPGWASVQTSVILLYSEGNCPSVEHDGKATLWGLSGFVRLSSLCFVLLGPASTLLFSTMFFSLKGFHLFLTLRCLTPVCWLSAAVRKSLDHLLTFAEWEEWFVVVLVRVCVFGLQSDPFWLLTFDQRLH